MSKNIQAIERIDKLENSVASHMQYIYKNIRTPFSMSELIINEESNILYDGKIFSKKAKTDLLSLFRAKGDFISENNKNVVGEDNMRIIIDLFGSIPIYGKVFLEFDNYDAPIYVDSVWVSKDFIDVNKIPTFTQFFNRLKHNLQESEVSYDIHEIRFNTEKAEVRISLYTTDTFKDNSSNGVSWHEGIDITFNMYETKVAPYYLKSDDLSGVISKLGASEINIKNKNYTVDKLDSLLGKYIINNYYKEIKSAFLEKLESSKNINLSILEAYSIFNILDEGFINDNKDISDKFNLDYLMKIYKVNIENQSKKWKSTADSNKTAYNVFLDLIWVASRVVEYGMDAKMGDKLKLYAFNLLFKNDFDLNNLAPKVNF